MDEIKKVFTKTIGIDSFRRIDDLHPLDLYLGIDAMSRYTLFLITENEPKHLHSSQIISVQIGLRSDKRWGLSFSLINTQFTDVFCHFCKDIIDSSRLIKSNTDDALFICSRYTKWQNMFSKYNGGLLSESSIKGLIGELYFLNSYLFPLYGEEKSLNSWIGPNKADQDFVVDATWYEVKSTVSGAENIRVSSVEQLDTANEGELIIIYLDKTSCADENKVTLNSIYKHILDSLSNEFLKQKLNDILLNLGYYYRAEYDEYIYRFLKMDRYSVNSSFPSLRRCSLPTALVNAKYQLSVSFISNFLKED